MITLNAEDLSNVNFRRRHDSRPDLFDPLPSCITTHDVSLTNSVPLPLQTRAPTTTWRAESVSGSISVDAQISKTFSRESSAGPYGPLRLELLQERLALRVACQWRRSSCRTSPKLESSAGRLSVRTLLWGDLLHLALADCSHDSSSLNALNALLL